NLPRADEVSENPDLNVAYLDCELLCDLSRQRSVLKIDGAVTVKADLLCEPRGRHDSRLRCVVSEEELALIRCQLLFDRAERRDVLGDRGNGVLPLHLPPLLERWQ